MLRLMRAIPVVILLQMTTGTVVVLYLLKANLTLVLPSMKPVLTLNMSMVMSQVLLKWIFTVMPCQVVVMKLSPTLPSHVYVMPLLSTKMS